MSNTFLYILWGALYVVCAGMGFITGPEGFTFALLVAFSLAFFVPPFLLLHRASKTDDRKTLKLIRNLSLIWLCVATLMIILNIASVAMSAAAGTALYYGLILLTAPMVCGQYWLLSLFLWAFLLMSALKHLKHKKG